MNKADGRIFVILETDLLTRNSPVRFRFDQNFEEDFLCPLKKTAHHLFPRGINRSISWRFDAEKQLEAQSVFFFVTRTKFKKSVPFVAFQQKKAITWR
jgi:hypothetical protein